LPKTNNQFSSRRLIMRPFRPEDATALAKGLGDKKVADYLNHVPDNYQLSDAHSFINSVQGKQSNHRLALAINLKSAPHALIGGFGLSALPDEGAARVREKMPVADGPIASIGYWVARPHWNKGYASEMLKTMRPACSDVFDLSLIAAMVFAHNVASLRVLAKANFVNLGTVTSKAAKNTGQAAHVLVWRSRL
jgi:RimJ/RimL family protein N-acetyltransferase